MNDHSLVTYDDTSLPRPIDVHDNASLALVRQEIDIQVSTARAFPRSVAKAVARIKEYATLDPETAQECVYALKRSGKMLNGPSIRFAEIVGANWGNARTVARVTRIDRFEGFIEAEAVFYDLETNYATTGTARRRIKGTEGKLYTDDMILVTGQACCSIAKRNAILEGVSKGVWRSGYRAVMAVVAGDLKTLSARRDAALALFGKIGVTPEQIFAALGVVGLEDIGADQFVTLEAFRAALKSGEETLESLFPSKGTSKRRSTEDELDAMATAKAAGSIPPHDAKTGEVYPDRNIASDAASPSGASDVDEGASGRTVFDDSAGSISGDGPAPRSSAKSSVAKPSVKAAPTKPVAEAPAPVSRGPKIGDDLERDAATLADLRSQGDLVADRGKAALLDFEGQLTDYEADLLDPFVGGLRRKAKTASET